MSESKGKPEGEHIEELLSQLKGIFGHLSDADQEEAKQKITPPPARDLKESLPQAPAPAQPPPEPALDPVPFNEEPAAPTPELDLPPEPAPEAPPTINLDLPPLDSLDDLPAAEPGAPTPLPADFTPTETPVPPGAVLVPTAVFYPMGRINEAKSVSDKVERITPKFTKVAVVINVQALAAYDPKSDIRAAITAQMASNPQIKAAFLLIDKVMDEARRKALVADLDPKGIYFQEIPLHQIEKKAIYTDMLLGMVFFFDSRKPKESES